MLHISVQVYMVGAMSFGTALVSTVSNAYIIKNLCEKWKNPKYD